jgi:hypothetical protein
MLDYQLSRVERLRETLKGFTKLAAFLRRNPGRRVSLGYSDPKRFLVEEGKELAYATGVIRDTTADLRQTTRTRARIVTRRERQRNAEARVHLKKAQAKALRARDARSQPSIPPSVLPGRPGRPARVGLMTAKG